MVNLVIPQAIISVVAIIGFFSPSTTTSQRSEKVNLGITTLLAMSVLLLMVSDSMPKTSNYVPMINVYFLLMIILNSTATIVSSMIITLQRRGEYNKKLPISVKRIMFRYLGPMLRIRPPKGMQVGRLVNSARKQGTLMTPLLLHPMEDASDEEEVLPCPELSLRGVLVKNFRLLSSEIRKIDRFVRFRAASDLISLEYEYLAAIMDRLCLLAFLTANLIVTSSFLALGYMHQADVGKTVV